MKITRYLFLMLFLFPFSSQAIDLGFEKLLSPGPLSKAHEKYEGECEQCHDKKAKNKEKGLCLQCHEDIAADLDKNLGFHGKNSGVIQGECRACHSEHKGLSATIIQWTPQSFDHKITDFPLHGAHQTLACDQCHSNEQKFRDAPHECYSCHEKDDIHQGHQGKECDSCHSTVNWRETKFDHDTTDFPLHGAHQKVPCNQCHRSSVHSEVESTCNACHAIDDRHQGSMGSDCRSCHNSNSWKESSFNHNTDTQFKLRGGHEGISCESCHSVGSDPTKTETQCISCHRNDDVHFGSNGQDCLQCHNTFSWKQNQFDHSKTKFPLHGAHTNVRCESCHKGDVNKPIKNTECGACHQFDDVHKNSLGDHCDQCHNDNSWNQDILFDHDVSHFPLLGMHATTACESCHEDFVFKGVSQNCVQCHELDNPHEKNLGTQCNLCHHPVSWQAWHFDHNTQSKYSLEGSHENLHCDDCHRDPLDRFTQKSHTCGSCHHQDDVHRGAYGDQCDRCHNTTRFRELEIR